MDITFQAKFNPGDSAYVVQQLATDFSVKKVEVIDVSYEMESQAVFYKFKFEESGKELKARENMLHTTRAGAEEQLVNFATECLKVYDDRIAEVTQEYQSAVDGMKKGFDETLDGLRLDKEKLQAVIDAPLEAVVEDVTPKAVPNET